MTLDLEEIRFKWEGWAASRGLRPHSTTIANAAYDDIPALIKEVERVRAEIEESLTIIEGLVNEAEFVIDHHPNGRFGPELARAKLRLAQAALEEQ